MPINGNKLKLKNGHTHTQDIASDVWTIEHNLHREVVSDIMVDYGGTREKILPLAVEHPSNTTMIVRFSEPFTGTARVI